MNDMRRTRPVMMVLMMLLWSACAVMAADGEEKAVSSEAAWTYPCVPLPWLVVMVVMLLLYLRTTTWVDADTHRLGLKQKGWNLAFVMLIGVQAVLLFAVPIYISIPVGLLAYVILLNRFVHYRNQQVLDRDKVFTREHMRVSGRRFMIRLGFKVSMTETPTTTLSHDHVPVLLLDSEGNVVSQADRLDKDEVTQKLKDLLAQARKDRVRELHLVQMGSGVKVLFCIDGVLNQAGDMERQLGSAMMLKFKSLVRQIGVAGQSEEDLSRFTVVFPQLRQECSATVYNQVVQNRSHTVVQLRGPVAKPLTLDELGMDASMAAWIRKLTDDNEGVVLFGGPRGSGHRTTIYAVLDSLDAYTRNIGTVETEPFLRRLANISQQRPADTPGQSVPEILAEMFRQDLNVAMLEGIAGPETVTFCLEESLKEHLVILGAEVPDVVSGLTGLLKLDRPKLVADALRAIVNQRLVRVLCRHCRRQYVPDAEVLDRMSEHLGSEGDRDFYEEVGCDECANTGFIGRVGVYEFLPVSVAVKECIVEGGSSADIMKVARDAGYVSLQRSALQKVAQGITSLKEVDRVLS